ncbi:MAG: hypothetical protein FWD92_03470 [Methanomassiliicoccaceae archaeon]|nr:hypothetical protein [Methanomassiliicoccaceae archaeon]
MSEFAILEQAIIVLLAGTTGFLFLHSSWSNAYTDALKKAEREKTEAEIGGTEAYAEWCLIHGKDHIRLKKGMSNAVWLQNAAVLVIGSLLTLAVTEHWLAPLFLENVGMAGMYTAAIFGGVLIVILWDHVLENYVGMFLTKIKLKGLEALNDSNVAKRKDELINVMKPRGRS